MNQRLARADRSILRQGQGLGRLQVQAAAAGEVQLQPPSLEVVAAVAGQGAWGNLAAWGVEGITQQGRPDCGAVNADLVGAAAGDGHLHQIGLAAALQQGEGAAGRAV